MSELKFNLASSEYLEAIYQKYLEDPSSVGEEWVQVFSDLQNGVPSASPSAAPVAISAEQGLDNLVHSYRESGHFAADLDPLGNRQRHHPLLELSEFGYSENDLTRQVGKGTFLGETDGTLGGLVEALRTTYCGKVGVEYLDIADKERRDWLEAHMEPVRNAPSFSRAQCRTVLEQLLTAEGLERFLHTHFVGHKRFSIEGAEALIPLLLGLVEASAESDAQVCVLGMAHRGRLNVLAHVLRKPYELILSEFEGTIPEQESEGEGDVKYHLGYSTDHMSASGKKVHLSLSANPSHLELVGPVIEGMVKAKQQYLKDTTRDKVIPIIMHGEASFTGQGIVEETLNLSQLPGYRTGGTLHIIINNQLGFTATADQTRFTPYPTDVAKTIRAPIFHVNGDDPEAVLHVAQLATAYRQQFKADVFIDLWCYRRYGHNETDDPSYTQPLMYARINAHPTVATIYGERLLQKELVHEAEIRTMSDKVRGELSDALKGAKDFRPKQRVSSLGGVWQGISQSTKQWVPETAVTADVLRKISEGATRVPEAFQIHPKLKRLIGARKEMAEGRRGVDWACAEMWAIGSLLLEKTPVRFTGQDTERGTFSHRHAVWHDQKSEATHVPLNHLAEDQAPLTILNTLLSELAVVGFEYGFSSADPRNLVMWEAQFGDFVNEAQPIIDQFIAAAEAKWKRMSGLVLLLPHGYEGQGPEHSSARLERFLQLCATDNLIVCYPTLPSQYFHLLRLQIRREVRKPLIIMAPKSNLRREQVDPELKEFCAQKFREVIDDDRVTDPKVVRRVLLCSGKVFFTLTGAPEAATNPSTAVIRVEQLYPFPDAAIKLALSRYPNLEKVIWVQEEPKNMGAWNFMFERLMQVIPGGVKGPEYIGRKEAANPATGSFAVHERQEKELVRSAFADGGENV